MTSESIIGKVLLSGTSLELIAATRALIEHDREFSTVFGYSNPPLYFLNILLQNGATEFVIHKEYGGMMKFLPKYLQKRIKIVPEQKYQRIHRKIQELIKSHAKSTADKNDVRMLSDYLSELMFSAEHGFRLASSLGDPNIVNRLDTILCEEIAIPIKILLSYHHVSEIQSPSIQKDISERNIFLVDEIMRSVQYEKYCASHKALKDTRKPLSYLIEHISKHGRAISLDYDTVLDLKRASFGIFNIVEDTIDQFVPFLSIKPLSAILERSLTSKRLIIYDPRVILREDKFAQWQKRQNIDDQE